MITDGVVLDTVTAAGACLGRFELLRPLGQGGGGSVWLVQDPELGRQVALKVLHQTGSVAESRDRIRREVRALAAINHPGVAQVYEVGEAPWPEGSGTLLTFLVMEYVPGQTLAERLRRGPLPLPDALATAAAILEGLAAAHDHFITHRDVKPANVMLTVSGGVKVLDLGLAKLLVDDDEARPSGGRPDPPGGVTGPTGFGGTPGYMAPEQATGRSTDLRTDVWAFGMVLVEMLTGRPAIRSDVGLGAMVAAEDFRFTPDLVPANTPASVLRILARCLSYEPVARYHHARDVLHDLREATDEISAPRSQSFSQKAALLVMDTALGSTRRGALIRHHQVLGADDSGPDPTVAGMWHRFEHRLGWMVAAVCVLVLIAGLAAGQWWQTGKVRTARAETASEEARSEALEELIEEVFRRARDEMEGSTAIEPAALLHASLAVVADGLPEGSPERGAVSTAAGIAFYRLEDYQRAADWFAQAVAVLRVDPATKANDLAFAIYRSGDALAETGDRERALALFEEALEIELGHGQLQGTLAAKISTSRGFLWEDGGHYDEAEAAYRETLGMQLELAGEEDVPARAPSDEPAVVEAYQEIAKTLHRIAYACYEQDRYEPAEKAYEQALLLKSHTVGEEHRSYITSLTGFANVIADSGRTEQADDLQRRALVLAEKVSGPESLDVAFLLVNMGVELKRRARYEEALDNYRRSRVILERIQGPNHEHVALVMNNISSVLLSMGEQEKALAISLQVLGIRRRIFSGDHPELAMTLENVGHMLSSMGHHDEAVSYFEEGLSMFEMTLGADNAATLSCLASLGRCLRRGGRFERSLELLDQAVDGLGARGDSPVYLATAQYDLAITLWETGERERAEEMVRLALVGAEQVGETDRVGPDDILEWMADRGIEREPSLTVTAGDR